MMMAQMSIELPKIHKTNAKVECFGRRILVEWALPTYSTLYEARNKEL
jgi:hypothetical protein